MRETIEAQNLAANASEAKPIAKWLKTNSPAVSSIAAILAAVFTAFQISINKTISETAQASNRAFIFFEEAALVPYPPVGELKVYAVVAKISNTGNTYGRNLKIKFDCPSRKAGEPRVTDPFALGQRWAEHDFGPPAMLGPKQSAPLIACEFTPADLASARRNEADFYFLAEVRYVDAFNEPHVTQMTRSLLTDTSGGVRFGFVGRNCADKDCPKPAGYPAARKK